jgi:hypothetical protein
MTFALSVERFAKWLDSYFVKPNTALDRDVCSVHDEKALFDEDKFVLERDMEAEKPPGRKVMVPYWYNSPNFYHLCLIYSI